MSNPYEPSRESSTVESSGPSSRLVRWRLAPALFFGTLGAVGTAVAILFLIACVPNIVRMWNNVEFRNYILRRKWANLGCYFSVHRSQLCGESLGSFLPSVFGNVDGKWPVAW